MGKEVLTFGSHLKDELAGLVSLPDTLQEAGCHGGLGQARAHGQGQDQDESAAGHRSAFSFRRLFEIDWSHNLNRVWPSALICRARTRHKFLSFDPFLKTAVELEPRRFVSYFLASSFLSSTSFLQPGLLNNLWPSLVLLKAHKLCKRKYRLIL